MRLDTAADATFGIDYDSLGRIADLPGQHSGGGTLETSDFFDDLTWLALIAAAVSASILLLTRSFAVDQAW